MAEVGLRLGVVGKEMGWVTLTLLEQFGHDVLVVVSSFHFFGACVLAFSRLSVTQILKVKHYTLKLIWEKVSQQTVPLCINHYNLLKNGSGLKC